MIADQRLLILDTTLRDGMQGLDVPAADKLRIAALLDEAGVDIIEAGYVGSTRGDAELVRDMSRAVRHATVCSLAQPKKADISAAARAIEHARAPRIHTFVSTRIVRSARDGVLATIDDSVRHARGLCADVQWTAADATRSERDFLARAVRSALDAGATTISIADTAGRALPHELAELVSFLRAAVPGLARVVLAVHGHDDLHLATANSLAAIRAGARQVECTVRGLGPRGGNTDLEQLIGAIAARPDALPYATGLEPTALARLAGAVSAVADPLDRTPRR